MFPKFFDIENFNHFSLELQQIQLAGAMFTLILIAIGLYGKFKFPEQRKMAWIISLANSGITMMIGLAYLIVKRGIYSKVFTFESTGRELFHGIDNVSALTCLWFALANIFDLVFGLLFYRKQLGLITAYFHHSVFIWMMVAATTGNGGFLKVTQFAPAFTAMLIEEFPTFLLALGSVFPSLRSDIGFGLSFFLLRIVLHTLYLVYGVYSGIDKPVVGLYLLTLVMHLNWFYTWVTKYGVKLLKTESSAAKKST